MSLKHFVFILLSLIYTPSRAQVLTLQQAVSLGVKNYGTVKAKEDYARASAALASQARREALPNVVLSAQQDYGTINGQNGPLYGFGGYAVSSSGLPLPQQNWNATFGALYLANFNWEFFAFGRAHQRTQTARAVADRDEKDLEQETFKQKVKIAGAYLNLLAAQKLVYSYEKNLARADTFRQTIRAKALNGLVAGVDSSQANAETSNAQIALTKARDFEQEQASQLAMLMGEPLRAFSLDSFFMSRIPATQRGATPAESHPVLKWYASRIDVSNKQMHYLKTFYYPTFSAVGILQKRASGFGSNYAVDQTDYTNDYLTGISPTRGNYLLGLAMTWNLTQPLRTAQQVKAQRYISKGLQDEYDMANQQIGVQGQLADTKMKYALDNYREVGVQVKAASDAYLQKSVLYKNGLTTLVDLTQAMYVLVRAETDRDVAYSNVWQALLLQSAAAGDFSLFESQL